METFEKDDKVRHRFRDNKYQSCVVLEVGEGCNGLVKVFCKDGFYGKPEESKFPPQDLEKVPLKEVTITVADDDLYINCPTCDMWELLNVDTPRKRLSVFPIIEWLPDVKDRPEQSIHKCCDCKETFKVHWDYDNTENSN